MMLRDILPVAPETRQELIDIYGEPAQTWDEVENWDDCVIPEEKSLTSELKEEGKGLEICPFFKVKGDHFNYCDARAQKLSKQGYALNDEVPTLNSAEYHSKLDHFSLQLWCLKDSTRYCECISYKFAEIGKSSPE